jgi:hypothetical protein
MAEEKTMSEDAVMIDIAKKGGPFLWADLTVHGPKPVELHTHHEDWIQKQSLGQIAKTADKWYIYDINGADDWFAPLASGPDGRCFFQTPQGAIRALWYIRRTIDSNPCPDSIRNYIHRRANLLNDARRYLLIQLDLIQAERKIINSLAKEHKLELNAPELTLEKELEDLVQFMEEHNDALYAQMGKDFARSLRAYVAAVVRMVNPDAASRI